MQKHQNFFLLITELSNMKHVLSQSEALLQWHYQKFYRFTRDEHLSVFSCERVPLRITLMYDCTITGRKICQDFVVLHQPYSLNDNVSQISHGKKKLSGIKRLVVLKTIIFLITIDFTDKWWLHNWFEQLFDTYQYLYNFIQKTKKCVYIYNRNMKVEVFC